MNKRYVFVVIVFFLLMGPGPGALFLNKYSITLMPLLCALIVFLLLKDEIYRASFDLIMKSKQTYEWTLTALKYAIFAHALCTLLFQPHMNFSDVLISTYVVMPFYAIVFGPIIEEIVYRKILFGYLNNRFNFWLGAVVTSALFAVSHFNLGRLLGYFAVGMIFCYVYKRSNSIVPTMLAHVSLNFISIAVSTLRG